MLPFPPSPSPRLFKHLSSSSSPTSQDEEEHAIKTLKTALSPEDTLIAEKFHSLMKEHYLSNPRKTPPPDPTYTISSLSLDFSQIISTVRSISPSIVRHVIARPSVPSPHPSFVTSLHSPVRFVTVSQCLKSLLSSTGLAIKTVFVNPLRLTMKWLIFLVR